MCFNRALCIVLFFTISSQLKAEHVYQDEQQNATTFVQLLYKKQAVMELPLPQRLEKISSMFLGRPYLLGALGEGVSGRYDQYPLFRVDAFDCLTFVETVLALTLADSPDSFDRMMKKIRYQDGRVSFLMRNHFTDLDWNPHNQANGLIKDVTMNIHNQHQEPIAIIASAIINKPSWYQHFSSSRIRLAQPFLSEKTTRLVELKKRGQALKIQTANIPYIPLTAIFDASGKANTAILKQIPNGAIIEMIRPNWDLRNVIGTSLNVSHLGFAFWLNGTLVFRNASTLNGHVVDEPLVSYLRKSLNSPTIKGINVQVVEH